MRYVASTPAEFVQWRRVVVNAYHELTGGYVESDFNETMLATLYENDQDETSAVRDLTLQWFAAGQYEREQGSFSMHDVFRAVDNAFHKIGVS